MIVRGISPDESEGGITIAGNYSADVRPSFDLSAAVFADLDALHGGLERRTAFVV
jgi:hypothetical protein